MPHDDRPLTCPRCEALLVGAGPPCPDPAAHDRVKGSGIKPIRTYGGQVKTTYDVDADGYVLVPFQRYDGAVRVFRTMWNVLNPLTGRRIPFAFPEPKLDKEALYFVTGMGPSSFESSSAAFPGRIPGVRNVEVLTITFLSDFLFGHVARNGRVWHRRTRRELKKRHTANCPPGCRKYHRRT
jgi:hypothetical protein